ncbi:unnamed protein product, partial [Ectocarpus fasciculatus]
RPSTSARNSVRFWRTCSPAAANASSCFARNSSVHADLDLTPAARSSRLPSVDISLAVPLEVIAGPAPSLAAAAAAAAGPAPPPACDLRNASSSMRNSSRHLATR